MITLRTLAACTCSNLLLFTLFAIVSVLFSFEQALALEVSTVFSQKEKRKYLIENLNPIMSGVEVSKSGNVIAVGRNGPMLVSYDRGATWSRQWLGRNSDLVGIAAGSDKTNLWVAGRSALNGGGEIYLSEDEGVTWRLYIGDIKSELRSITVSNDGSQFWVTSAEGKIWHGSRNADGIDLVADMGPSADLTVEKFLSQEIWSYWGNTD